MDRSCDIVTRPALPAGDASKTQKKLALHCVAHHIVAATHKFKGNAEREEVSFEKGAKIEVYEERRGWYRGYVLPDRAHGLIPGNHIKIVAEHEEMDIYPPGVRAMLLVRFVFAAHVIGQEEPAPAKKPTAGRKTAEARAWSLAFALGLCAHMCSPGAGCGGDADVFGGH